MNLCLVPNSNYAYPTTGWTDQSGSNGNQGVFRDSAYGLSSDPDGGSQGAYMAGGWIAQQIGTYTPGAVYTIDFSLSTDGGSTTASVALLDGSPTGTPLDSASGLTGLPSVWTPFSKTLTPVGGTAGDPLFLEFSNTGGFQTFVDGVTASYTVPEPASLGLLGIAVGGLLARRRRCA